MKLRTLAIACLLVVAFASSAFAVITPRFNISLPTGYTSKVSSTALSGTLNGLGCTATWTVTASAATVHYSGTVPSSVWSYNPPYWDVYFVSPGQPIGMNVDVMSTNNNPYRLQAEYNAGTWVYNLPETSFTGNQSLTCLWPTNSRADFEFMGLTINVPYDITVNYTFGDWAVPAETSSWGDVKALFR